MDIALHGHIWVAAPKVIPHGSCDCCQLPGNSSKCLHDYHKIEKAKASTYPLLVVGVSLVARRTRYITK